MTMPTSRKAYLTCLSLGQEEEMGGLVGIGFSIRINPIHVNKKTAPDNILKLFSRISSVHTYNTRASTSEHFYTKNVDSMSNEMLFRVLGSKFGMGYVKFLKKDPKKLLKDH